MLSFFKNKNQKKNNTRSSSYYLRENLIKNLTDLKNVLLTSASQSTEYPLTFLGYPLESVNNNNITTKLELETYILDNQSLLPEYQVFFYKKRTGKFKLLFQVHHFDNKIVFISTKFETDSMLTESEKQKIIDQLLGYYPDIKRESNNYNFSFSDKLGNKIFTRDDVFFYINYCPYAKTIEHLINEINRVKKVELEIPKEKDNFKDYI